MSSADALLPTVRNEKMISNWEELRVIKMACFRILR
jgi:hypothetical protein